MSHFLLSAAGISNIASVVTVVFGFCLMILYIARYIFEERQERNDQNRNYSIINIPRINLVPVRVPFTFKLFEAESASYAGVQYEVTSEVPYKLGIYWGVNIKKLHYFFRRSWENIIESFNAGLFLEECFESCEVIERNEPHAERHFTTKYTSDKPLELKNIPRSFYPLVIIIIQSNNGDIQGETEVALVSMIHIKDTVCKGLSTCVLDQYLKQRNGQFVCLKQLYLSAGRLVDEDTPIPMSVPKADPALLGFNSETEQEMQFCIVCQCYPLSRALLPCRHTCLCAKCFSRLDRCPICRGPIKSYFCIRNEDYMNEENQGSKETSERNWSFWNWLENWDDRITDFLGFRR